MENNTESYEISIVLENGMNVSLVTIVQIGNQIWMAENLKVTHYNNGDERPTGYSNSEWAILETGAYSVHGNDLANS